jgi:hypothetical protein
VDFVGTDVSEEHIVTGNAASSSLFLFTSMMQAISSSEILVLTGATTRHSLEDGILQVSYSSEAR